MLEHGRLLPTLQSLDYMRRLLWSDLRRYTVRTASNFLRDGDQKRFGLMGSVEVATFVHSSPEELVSELLQLRVEFARAARGALVVPVGALFTADAKTLTSGLHIHIGVPRNERHRIYSNLAHFLPVLAVASASSPYFNNEYFGLSHRMATPYALGPLQADREYRFQDLIISKRLGTIELRVFDPVPELGRLTQIVKAVHAIALWPGTAAFSREEYNGARTEWTKEGPNPWVLHRFEELRKIYALPLELVEQPFSKRLADITRQRGALAAYQEADATWRNQTGVHYPVKEHSKLRIASGIAGFYALRFPYMAYKGIREWRGSAP